MEFRIDRTSGLPAYLQLVRQVREALRMGWLSPGDRLPPVREVVTTSGVNANTVLKAYRELEMSGLVEARQGSGTYVKAALGSADPEVMGPLRTRLAEWVHDARAAGLDTEDVEALVRSVLVDEGGIG
ncbi:GntR family transcriptional regulator [Actinosynnema mirum]|uniref:Transcriptional regulator, GntR family n=1 Tax=Actinosynnema mirum (strain ATCC 29888 / DSM 43827 / JCM 3225 / NBRC 14064 / NCIMB 13271 / NRRL B-12336 / IMRU 3971 / 101) TaxID=446462 RepID=C6WKC1_ACTMD|nr:transcriptional regulator, GntR family [Actinosynnema mirum DSM 43827]AXX33687.1 Transcriptional regulator, GntR family [Actinosynnema pretiosum subsp. pretiosum]